MTETPEQEAVRVVAADPAVKRVILFGSRVWGTPRRSSDIDLAVDAPGAGAKERLRWEDALDRRRSLVAVDLLVLQEAPPEWRNRIERDGLLMFERAS